MPGLGRLMIGVDSTKVLRPLLLNAQGVVLVSGGGATPVFHYGGAYHEHAENLVPPAGIVALSTAALAAGLVAVVTIIAARDRTSAITSCTLTFQNGVLTQAALTVGALAANTQFVWNGTMYIPAGWYLTATFGGVTAGDDLFLDLSGYYMTL